MCNIVSEKASNILGRSEAKIHHIKYIDLAKNIDSLRSWANRIRNLTIDELESIEYGAIQFCNMRETHDYTLKHIDAANTILDSVREDAAISLRQSLSLGNELNRAGRVLGNFIGYLPITHRANDSIENSLFQKDVANRPIRTMYSVCVKTLTLMAELDAEVGENGKLKTWGKWRDQESRLRYWGHDRIDGQAPVDSYIEIGDNEETEDDAQFLYDAFSMILYIQYEYLRHRTSAHAASEPSMPQHLEEGKLEDCQFLYSRVYYILNTDFMFFPALERWSDKMITELARGSGVEDKYNFSVDPVDGVNAAIDMLQRLTKIITPNAFHMSHDPSVWPNGHLWGQSVEQVNKRSEGSERVVPKRSVLRDAIEYYEMLDIGEEAKAAKRAGKLRAWVAKSIKRLGL